MTADQYTDLVEFLGRKFDAIERRLTAIEERVVALEERVTSVERRLTVLELRHEAMRDDIRALAEGQAVINARVARLEERLDAFDNEARAGFAGLEVRFDRFEVDFGTVVLDHGRRIRALEQPGNAG